MNARRVEITLDQETWDRFELARGREPRASFVKRALESALSETKGPFGSEQGGPGPVPSSEGVRPAASSRASKKKPSVADTELL